MKKILPLWFWWLFAPAARLPFRRDLRAFLWDPVLRLDSSVR